MPPPRPSCPSLAEIEAFNSGRIADDARLVSIADHLEVCPHCVEVLCGLPDDTFWNRDATEDASTLTGEESQVLEQALARIESLPQLLERVVPLSPIGDYQVLERLGGGSQGTVYKAWHPRLHRAVVLKTLREPVASEPAAVAQFDREMSALGRLNHSSIVKAYDVVKCGGRDFLVMEFVDGENLRDVVRREGPLSVPDACAVAHEVALGLQHLHDTGLVHRDVKPSNIALSPEGRIKILDLGLAFHLESGNADAAHAGPLGTRDYMAPEQGADRSRVGTAADIYSLGATLARLLGLRVATEGSAACRLESAATPFASATSISPRSDIPRSLRILIGKMLDEVPERRPGSANEVARLLHPFARRSRRIAITETSFTSVRPASWSTIAGGGVVLLVVTVGLLAVRMFYHEQTLSSRPSEDQRLPATLGKPTGDPAVRNGDLADRAAATGTEGGPIDSGVARPPFQYWRMGATGNMLAGLAAIPPKFAPFERWQVETVQSRGSLRDICSSPDGVLLAQVSDDENIRIFLRSPEGMELHKILPTTASGIACPRWLAWDPRGDLLVVAMGAANRPIEIWDWKLGQRVRELRGHDAAINAVCWNHQGTRLATAGSDGRVRIWDRNGIIVRSFEFGERECSALTWSPGGMAVTVGLGDGGVYECDVESGARRELIDSRGDAILALAASFEGAELAVVTADHWLIVLDLTAGAKLRPKKRRIPTPFRRLIWSSGDASWYVVADILWRCHPDRDELQIVAPSPRPGDPWVAGTCSPGGKTLLLASTNGSVGEWPVGGGALKLLARPPLVYLCDLAWNRESTRLAICSLDGQVQIWGGQGRPMGVVRPAMQRGETIGIRCAGWSLGGRYLAAADHAPVNSVHVWDVDSFEEIAVLQAEGPIESLAWSDDTRWLVTVGPGGCVQTWDVPAKKPGDRFTGHHGHVSTVSNLAHTRQFATGDLDGTIHVWEITDAGKVRPLMEFPRQAEPVWSVAWSPQGERLAVAGTHHVWMLDGGSGKSLWAQATPTPAVHVSWKNDGQRVFCNGAGVLLAEDGKVLAPLVAYPLPASYSPDGRWVAEAARPAAVTIHHASTQLPIWRGVPLDGNSSVTLSPAGQIIYFHGDYESQLRYVVETRPNYFETLLPRSFERRIERRISK